jgi:uncharacterized protein
MPRKYFKKYLPSRDSFSRNRHVAFLSTRLHHPNLWHLNRYSVAGGAAIGVLCGLIPGPVQMLCAAVLAVLLRVNLAVAVVSTWYTNPFTIVPIYYLAYRIGNWLMGARSAPDRVPHLELTLDNFATWIPMLVDWVSALGKPLAVGLAVLGIGLTVTTYFAVLAGWRVYVTRQWRRRQRHRSE